MVKYVSGGVSVDEEDFWTCWARVDLPGADFLPVLLTNADLESQVPHLAFKVGHQLDAKWHLQKESRCTLEGLDFAIFKLILSLFF